MNKKTFATEKVYSVRFSVCAHLDMQAASLFLFLLFAPEHTVSHLWPTTVLTSLGKVRGCLSSSDALCFSVRLQRREGAGVALTTCRCPTSSGMQLLVSPRRREVLISSRAMQRSYLLPRRHFLLRRFRTRRRRKQVKLVRPR